MSMFDDKTIIIFLFKAFAIAFAFIYLLYSIVLKKQTSVMNNTVKDKLADFIATVSFIQIGLAVMLISVALLSQ